MDFRKNNSIDAFIDFLIDKVLVPELESKGGEFQNVSSIQDSRDDETLPIPQELV